MTLADIITGIIVREGSEYSNRAADRGGPTKYGITLTTLAAHRKHACTSADVEALQESEAREIYMQDFVVSPGFHQIENESVRVLVVDSGVQHGTGMATKFLQKAAHVFADGQLGTKTLEAVNRMTPVALFLRVYAEREKFYGALIAHDPEALKAKDQGFDRLQAFNALGWANRMTTLLEMACEFQR